MMMMIYDVDDDADDVGLQVLGEAWGRGLEQHSTKNVKI